MSCWIHFEFKKTPIKKEVYKFDDGAKKEFLNGAKIAYETIITSFASGKISEIKSLINKDIYHSFNEAIKERSVKQLKNETTFIGINSAEIKNHENNKGFLEVTVDFASEIISCIKDKDNKVLSGDPKKIKKVYDTWVFSKETSSNNPNWLLIGTESWLSKISDKDKKDWNNFINSSQRVENKDKDSVSKENTQSYISIDLHGYTLDEANKKVKEIIISCSKNKYREILLITGKGLHSTSGEDTYVSSDLSKLRYSVPEFISSDDELKNYLISIEEAEKKDGGDGAILIKLKNL